MIEEAVQRYQRVLAALIATQGWQLDGAAPQMYVKQMAHYVGANPNAPDDELRQMLIWYHQSHVQVQQLIEQHNPAHDEAWETMFKQITAILRHEGLDHVSTHELDDMIQLTAEALTNALKTFSYKAKFSTWVYRVVVNRARRAHRDQQATKRTADVESIDQTPHLENLVRSDNVLEQLIEGHELYELAVRILEQQRDQRLVLIFQRWFKCDQRLISIGEELGLSPSRVSVLLEQALTVLREHPDLGDWYHPTSD